jgi:hypothetical protein
MYGILLGVFKLLSDGLTAVSGIYGLLSDFRDPDTKRITPAGKRAIVGIAIGFLISCGITILEHEKAIAEERAHALEIKRLANPLGQLELEVLWEVTKEDETIAAFKKNLELADPNSDGQMGMQSLPDQLRDSVPKQLDVPESMDLRLFGGIPGPCPTNRPTTWKNDMWLHPHKPMLLRNDTSVSVGTTKDNHLLIQQRFTLDVAASTGNIASDEDLSGVKLWISLPQDIYWPKFLSLETSHGRSFGNVEKQEVKWSKPDFFTYCYVLK